jgi:hypothetical protein
MKAAIYLDSFSGAAAELRPGHRSPFDVLEALKRDPRVSTFDMSETPWLRGAIDALKANGAIESVPEPYPWLRYKIKEQGNG